MDIKVFSHRYVTLSWDFDLGDCSSCEIEIGEQLFIKGPALTAANMRHFCVTWAEKNGGLKGQIPTEFSHFERRLDTDAAVTWETFVNVDASAKNLPLGKVPIPPILFEHLPAFAFTTVERVIELADDFSHVESQIDWELKKRAARAA